jgi:hypothetical protein
MLNNEFMQVVSFDLALFGSICEWCGQPAEQELTVPDGNFYNESGCFCRLCREECASAVALTLLKLKKRRVLRQNILS